MMKNDWLARAPILVEDFDTIFRFDEVLGHWKRLRCFGLR
jgi:hypothetical protein